MPIKLQDIHSLEYDLGNELNHKVKVVEVIKYVEVIK